MELGKSGNPMKMIRHVVRGGDINRLPSIAPPFSSLVTELRSSLPMGCESRVAIDKR